MVTADVSDNGGFVTQQGVRRATMRPTRAAAGALLGALLLVVLSGAPPRHAPAPTPPLVQIGAVTLTGAVHEARQTGDPAIDQMSHDPGGNVTQDATA